jgi:hypothetical protein
MSATPRPVVFTERAMAFFLLYGIADTAVNVMTRSDTGTSSWQFISAAAAYALGMACLVGLIPLTLLLDRPRPVVAPTCYHRNAIPVEALLGEVVAKLCPDCGEQLDAGCSADEGTPRTLGEWTRRPAGRPR